MISQVLSHYRITRKLGAGGMGEVYLAEDTRLGRNVAIKVLPSKFTQDAERLRRFEQEARAASALNHPNIITIYDLGQSEDVRFIVTEFIDGETLRGRIARSRPTIHEALDISIQVAGAMAAAHEVGIIHRDIKPENIMLRPDGYVKVLDFGLAKLTERQAVPAGSDTPTRLRIDTEAGTVMGTISYMSPEQARGIGVDAPTDVFSLGVVMYEMFAGCLPFRGDTAVDVLLSILQTDPPPLSTLSPHVPVDLERIVIKALAKDRNERYQNADELAGELRRLKQRLEVAAEVRQAKQSGGTQKTSSLRQATSVMDASGETSAQSKTMVGSGQHHSGMSLRYGRTGLALVALLAVLIGAASIFLATRGKGESIRTLAVLPFLNSGNDQDAEYLSDGITETLINSLSQLPDLKVMSRSAVWRYKVTGPNAPFDARNVGHDLNVRAVLTGRVTRQGDNLGISVELIDSRDSSQIWGGHYNRSKAEVLAVQEEIANRILEKLRFKLSGDDRRRLAKRYTDDTEAYDRYIRGRYYLNKRSADAIRTGRDFFRQAIESDPGYALAYAGMSDSYALLAAQAALGPQEAYPAAVAAAQKSIELDAGLGEGHASLAHAAFHVGDLAVAKREFARAIELKPNYLPAFQWQSEYFAAAGQQDEALAAARHALQLDPLDLAANAQVASVFIQKAEYGKAAAQLRKTLELDPNYFLAHALLGKVYLQTRRFPQAVVEYSETARLTGGRRGLDGLGLAYAMSGRKQEARRVLDEMEARSKDRYIDVLEIARIHGVLKNKEETIFWLTRALAQHPQSIASIRDDQEFAFLRSDPRFLKLLGTPD